MTLNEAIQLGLEHHTAGRFQQAEQIYRQVLQHSPAHPEALNLLGCLAHQVGRSDVAVDLIGRAAAANPSSARILSNLSDAQRSLGQFQQAESSARQAISLDPNMAHAHVNLGVALLSQNRSAEAEASLRRALQINPNQPQALTNLVTACLASGRIDEAIEFGQQAVRSAPKDAAAHNNLGTAYEQRGMLSEAENAYRRACEVSPQRVECLHNLGSVLRKCGRFEEAIEWWKRAAAVRPDQADIHWDLALAYLTIGDFDRGWPLYEWRFRSPSAAAQRREYPGAIWDGSDPAGKTILLYPEQGFGDAIQFARFIPVLARRGARVILHSPAELFRLMQTVDGLAQVIGPEEPCPPIDLYLPLMSLPLMLGTKLTTIPTDIPYIRPESGLSNRWHARISAASKGLKVGLVWAGRPTHTDDAIRSIRLAQLSPLAKIPNVTFLSLQKGAAATELVDVKPEIDVVDLKDDLGDFADTAAALVNLDLLISVDTVVAHLAGAIGLPVWTLIATAHDFRWMVDREDSPWYPTMRLFRQKQPGDWAEVIQRVFAALDRLAAGAPQRD